MRYAKCVVWDLDDTVWDGVLSEGGATCLRRGVMETLRALDDRGILQSIASANDFASAWACLQRFGIERYFVFPEINWNLKADSISRIGKRCGFATQHIAFVDDDPYERQAVRHALPEVLVLSASEVPQMPLMSAFMPKVFSIVTHGRRDLLITEMQREVDSVRFPTYEDFLRTCRIRFTGEVATKEDCARLSELSFRTNRMNASGLRLTNDELLEWLTDPARYVLLGRLTDCYGDYGTIAGAVATVDGSVLCIEGLWISCRVAKLGLPGAFLSFLGMFAAKRGYSRLAVRYLPSAENRVAALHLGTYGFRLEADGTEGAGRYALALPSGICPLPDWITQGAHRWGSTL